MSGVSEAESEQKPEECLQENVIVLFNVPIKSEPCGKRLATQMAHKSPNTIR